MKYRLNALKSKSKLVLFTLLAMLLASCRDDVTNIKRGKYPSVEVPLPQLQKRPGQFSNCSEIQNYVDRRVQDMAREEANIYDWSQLPGNSMPVSASAPQAGAGNGSSRGSQANSQEVGIDEADYLKWNADYIFASRSGKVEVIAREGRKVIATMSVKTTRRPRLLLDQEHLYVIYQLGDLSTGILGPSIASKNLVQVESYRLQPAKLPKLEESLALQGELILARIEQSIVDLVVVSPLEITHPTYTIGGRGELFNREMKYPARTASILQGLKDGSLHGVSCGQVTKPMLEDFRLSITQYHRLNQGKLIASRGSLFDAQTVYRGPQNLYLTQTSFYWPFMDSRLTGTSYWSESIIHRLPVQGGDEDSTLLRGHLVNRWAMREQSDYFFAASTWWSGQRMENSLSSFRVQENFAFVNRSKPFGFNQSQFGIRYAGGKAYVITYQNVDPLHVIDLSNPENPTIRGELALPGVSLYLHSVSETELLGVGLTDDRRLQVNLFDVAQSDAPQLKDYWQVQGDSTSDVLVDTRAFLFDESQDRIAFPARWRTATELFSGAIFLNLKRLHEGEKKISHQALMPLECRLAQGNLSSPSSLDIERIVKIDSEYVLYSSFGLHFQSALEMNSNGMDLTFSDNSKECQRRLKADQDVRPGTRGSEYF